MFGYGFTVIVMEALFDPSALAVAVTVACSALVTLLEGALYVTD
jgi:hypothetical protein